MINKIVRTAFFLLILLGIIAIGGVFIYSPHIEVLSPKGLIADKQSYLLLLATIIMLFIVVPVFLLTFFIGWKYRAGNKDAEHKPDWDHSHLAESIWWGVPFIMIIILGVITWTSCHELDPFKPLDSKVKPIRVQAVALNWKWLFIYPDHGIATVNYFEVPEGTPINFEITADAPMNSFWIPKLAGQVYAMPGMRAKLHAQATGIHTYTGKSSNLSGKGFAGMTFTGKSATNEEFAQWVQSVKGSGNSLTMEQYNHLVLPSEYEPAAYFVLEEPGLFDQIIMKYMTPKGKGHAAAK